jgi:hypothetical protein
LDGNPDEPGHSTSPSTQAVHDTKIVAHAIADPDAARDADPLLDAATHAKRASQTRCAVGLYPNANRDAWANCAGSCALTHLDATIDTHLADEHDAQVNLATAWDTQADLAEANQATACDTHAHTPFDMAAFADQGAKANFATVDTTTLCANLAAGANTSADANSDSLSYREAIRKYGGHDADKVNVR